MERRRSAALLSHRQGRAGVRASSHVYTSSHTILKRYEIICDEVESTELKTDKRINEGREKEKKGN
jgi:hypothetical protein